MDEAELFFEYLIVKDRKEILTGIASDIKRENLQNEQKFIDFMIGLISEDIKIFSVYDSRLLTLHADKIAQLLLK